MWCCTVSFIIYAWLIISNYFLFTLCSMCSVNCYLWRDHLTQCFLTPLVIFQLLLIYVLLFLQKPLTIKSNKDQSVNACWSRQTEIIFASFKHRILKFSVICNRTKSVLICKSSVYFSAPSRLASVSSLRLLWRRRGPYCEENVSPRRFEITVEWKLNPIYTWHSSNALYMGRGRRRQPGCKYAPLSNS